MGGAHTPVGRPGSAAEVGGADRLPGLRGARLYHRPSIVVDGGNTIQEHKGA